MRRYVESQPAFAQASLAQAVELALCTWAVGSLAQAASESPAAESSSPRVSDEQTEGDGSSLPDKAALLAHVRQTVAEKSLECVLLERRGPGSAKYRALRPAELGGLLPPAVSEPAAT
jgi:proteasome alpha subunit